MLTGAVVCLLYGTKDSLVEGALPAPRLLLPLNVFMLVAQMVAIEKIWIKPEEKITKEL
jgi:hypothetical protein